MNRQVSSGRITYSESGMPLRDGLSLCSRRDPVEEARGWLGRTEVTPHRAIFVVGVGAGAHLELLRRNFQDQQIFSFDFDIELSPDVLVEPRDLGPSSDFNLVQTAYALPWLDVGYQVLCFRAAWVGRQTEFQKLAEALLFVDFVPPTLKQRKLAFALQELLA